MEETNERQWSPGWYAYPDRPGLELYWDGERFDPRIPPRPTPQRQQPPAPVWRQAWPIVLGILIAAAVIFTFWRLMQPSALDCETQRAEVLLGERVSVDSACLGR